MYTTNTAAQQHIEYTYTDKNHTIHKTYDMHIYVHTHVHIHTYNIHIAEAHTTHTCIFTSTRYNAEVRQ